jgi:hypothetical protein
VSVSLNHFGCSLALRLVAYSGQEHAAQEPTLCSADDLEEILEISSIFLVRPFFGDAD